MIKNLCGLLLGILLIISCGPKGAMEEGNDLTLNTTIAIEDLPVVGPINLKQTQMYSGNILRSVIKTSISVAGEEQALSSVFIINLDEGNLYFVNDADSTYVKMAFAEFDSMLTAANFPYDDTTMAPLTLTKREIQRMESEKKVIGQFGECTPVDFDLVLGSEGAAAPYQSSLSGRMWMSSSIENSSLFTDFQKKSFQMFQSSLAANPGFFGLAGMVNLDESWLKELNAAMTGIPVEADFEISMPIDEETISYGITLNLQDYLTADIDEGLLRVPDEYRQVDFSQFNMY